MSTGLEDDTYSIGAGGKSASKDYYRGKGRGRSGIFESPEAENKKTASEVRTANALYSPTEIDFDKLKIQPRQSPGKNFDRCFEAEVEVIGTNIDVRNYVIYSFPQLFWQPRLQKNLRECGYTTPMPVQKYTMGYLMDCRDVVACAPTGSGKTAAYLLPIIYYIMQRGDVDWVLPDRQHPYPAALIVVPTRELADQITHEARLYVEGTKIQVVSVYGATNLRHQVEFIRRNGCHILIGTPGRLLQLLNEGRFGLSKVKWVVLDEAHRMLSNMEEEPEVRQILNHPKLPVRGHYRITLMFSATFPKYIRKKAEEFLCDPVYVTVGKSGGANTDIVQEVQLVPEYQKYDKLHKLLTDDSKQTTDDGKRTTSKTLVFVERKNVADTIVARLAQMGISTATIHGDREQREREEAMRNFKTGKCPVLIATAVAARGLDMMGVDHVINFDLPASGDDYVHRIGRTGRVGNPGRSTAFYDPNADWTVAGAIVQVLRDAEQDVPEWLEEEANGGKAKKQGERMSMD